MTRMARRRGKKFTPSGAARMEKLETARLARLTPP